MKLNGNLLIRPLHYDYAEIHEGILPGKDLGWIVLRLERNPKKLAKDTINQLDFIPKSMVVQGGGIIGLGEKIEMG